MKSVVRFSKGKYRQYEVASMVYEILAIVAVAADLQTLLTGIRKALQNPLQCLQEHITLPSLYPMLHISQQFDSTYS